MHTIDLSDAANMRHWCQTWNVTENQLRIAVARVGTGPKDVRVDIYGAPAPFVASAQSWQQSPSPARRSRASRRAVAA